MKSLHRRTVLRGAGGVALALPWLEAMGLPGRGVARAGMSTTGFPKRFMVFFSPNGTVKPQWVPTGDATNWTLSPILKPLEPYKEHVTVLDGIRNEASYHGPGDGHQTGMGCMLTAIELLPGTTKGGCDTCAPAGYASGPSVDQVIVQKSPDKTKFPSIEAGVNAGARGTQWGYSNYQASNMPLPLENSPANVFKRVFTDFQPGGAAADPTLLMKLRAERKSLLDAVASHYQTISAKLGQSDRQRLQSHLQGVRELEQRLSMASTSAAAGGAGCAKPAMPGTSTDPQVVGDLQADLLVTAMACDLTRVGTIQWENSVGGMRFTWLGATRGHHDLSHDPDSNLDSQMWLTKINIYLSERLAYIAKKLKSIPEGPGTMLDNTLILWCNELNRGNAHDRAAMPFVLVGKAGGALRSNRLLKFTRINTGNLFVSILNMFDIPATTFGNPAYCTGALAGL